ncbi:hypothetical protein [Paracoccus methylarcula]|nr:hypothetical protein [Paracoccus methylarcula]
MSSLHTFHDLRPFGGFDLFSRQRRVGWVIWGNEAEKFQEATI